MIKIFFLHFLADFILQPREMGKKKSAHLGWLAGHLAIQFLVFLPFTGWLFSGVNTLIHGIIDGTIWGVYKLSVYCRSRRDINLWLKKISPGQNLPAGKQIYKNFAEEWEYWKDHWLYVTIGFDQFLHTATLVFLFNIS